MQISNKLCFIDLTYINKKKKCNFKLAYLCVSRHFESGFSGFSVVTSVPPPPPLPPVCSNPLHLYNVLIFFLSVSLNPFLEKIKEKRLNIQA